MYVKIPDKAIFSILEAHQKDHHKFTKMPIVKLKPRQFVFSLQSHFAYLLYILKTKRSFAHVVFASLNRRILPKSANILLKVEIIVLS